MIDYKEKIAALIAPHVEGLEQEEIYEESKVLFGLYAERFLR